MRALLLVLCACGGATATKPPEPAVEGAPKGDARGQITPEAFCDRFLKLKADGCEVFAKVEMTREECIGALGKMQGDPQETATMAQTGTCIVGFQTCGDVVKCLASLGPSADDLRACHDESSGKAVGVTKDEWAKRNGAGITRFSQTHSTKELPLEVCTIRAETELLASLACEDESHPIKDHESAEIARVGNVGKGGRCGSIIDLYRVKCPEATYELFVDGYVCPQ